MRTNVQVRQQNPIGLFQDILAWTNSRLRLRIDGIDDPEIIVARERSFLISYSPACFCSWQPAGRKSWLSRWASLPVPVSARRLSPGRIPFCTPIVPPQSSTGWIPYRWRIRLGLPADGPAVRRCCTIELGLWAAVRWLRDFGHRLRAPTNCSSGSGCRKRTAVISDGSAFTKMRWFIISPGMPTRWSIVSDVVQASQKSNLCQNRLTTYCQTGWSTAAGINSFLSPIISSTLDNCTVDPDGEIRRSASFGNRKVNIESGGLSISRVILSGFSSVIAFKSTIWMDSSLPLKSLLDNLFYRYPFICYNIHKIDSIL